MIDHNRFFPMRRALVLAGALLASGCVLWAQQDGPPPDGPPPGDMQQQQPGSNVDRELKHLTRLLTLTQDQQTQVKPILVEQGQQIKALFDQSRASAQSGDERPTPEAMTALRTQIKAIRTASNAKITALLTDAQKTKFAAWLEQQAKREAQHGSDDMPPPPDGEGGPPPDGGGGPPPGL